MRRLAGTLKMAMSQVSQSANQAAHPAMLAAVPCMLSLQELLTLTPPRPILNPRRRKHLALPCMHEAAFR